MPTFNFIKKKDNVIKTTDKKPDDSIGKIDTNNIKLYFDVISSKKVDREKTYYSTFFKSLFLFTNFNAKSYNILQNIITKKRDITIIFVFMKKKLKMLSSLKEIIPALIVFISVILFLIVIRILMLMYIL